MDLKLWSTEKAAEFLKKSPTSLTTWRSTGQHNIPFLKIGGTVYYHEDDLVKWVERQRKQGKK